MSRDIKFVGLCEFDSQRKNLFIINSHSVLKCLVH